MSVCSSASDHDSDSKNSAMEYTTPAGPKNKNSAVDNTNPTGPKNKNSAVDTSNPTGPKNSVVDTSNPTGQKNKNAKGNLYDFFSHKRMSLNKLLPPPPSFDQNNYDSDSGVFHNTPGNDQKVDNYQQYSTKHQNLRSSGQPRQHPTYQSTGDNQQNDSKKTSKKEKKSTQTHQNQQQNENTQTRQNRQQKNNDRANRNNNNGNDGQGNNNNDGKGNQRFDNFSDRNSQANDTDCKSDHQRKHYFNPIYSPSPPHQLLPPKHLSPSNQPLPQHKPSYLPNPNMPAQFNNINENFATQKVFNGLYAKLR